RTRNQMKFILDDQVRRFERVGHNAALARFRCPEKTDIVLEAIDMTEECSCLSNPWQAGKLVDRRDEKGRQTSIDRLINGQNGKRSIAAEFTLRIDAPDFEILRSNI